MSLTVACVWVRGHVPFTAEYVARLESMARKKFPAHRFVCLTDQPARLECETIKIDAMPKNVFAWWAKLELFNPKHRLRGRVVYLDLDTLLVDDCTPIVESPHLFALAPHAGTFQPKTKHRVVRRFNSSVMAFDAGEALSYLYESWHLKDAERLWGDQDWIGEQCHWATALPLEWFPRLSEALRPPWPPAAKVILCKKPKNADAAYMWKWFNEEWQ